MNNINIKIKPIAALMLIFSFTALSVSCGREQSDSFPSRSPVSTFVYDDSCYSTEYEHLSSAAGTEVSAEKVMTSIPVTDTPEISGQTPISESATDTGINKPAETTDNSESVTSAEQMPALTFKELQELLFNPDNATTAAKLLDLVGFSYDPKQDIYYSTLNPLQRGFGYNMAYDMLAPYLGMYFDTERLYFTYDNREWLIQIWKGQYGVTVGAEIGIYYRPKGSTSDTYSCVSDEDLIEMSMVLFKDGKAYLQRGPERHWWLTGFRLYDSADPSQLSMTIYIKLDKAGMADAFAKALDTNTELEYIRSEGDFLIDWKCAEK